MSALIACLLLAHAGDPEGSGRALHAASRREAISGYVPLFPAEVLRLRPIPRAIHSRPRRPGASRIDRFGDLLPIPHGDPCFDELRGIFPP